MFSFLTCRCLFFWGVSFICFSHLSDRLLVKRYFLRTLSRSFRDFDITQGSKFVRKKVRCQLFRVTWFDHFDHLQNKTRSAVALRYFPSICRIKNRSKKQQIIFTKKPILTTSISVETWSKEFKPIVLKNI